jgi:hypothetical protein
MAKGVRSVQNNPQRKSIIGCTSHIFGEKNRTELVGQELGSGEHRQPPDKYNYNHNSRCGHDSKEIHTPS